MSFRIEEKIPLTQSDMFVAQADLLAKGMTVLHPGRTIKSVYFETRNFLMFEHSEEGTLPRKKIRIRTYPDQDKASLSLEIKTSSVEGRFKTTEKITNEQAVDHELNGILDPHYGICVPILTVTYARNYYDYKGVRITFDTDIKYQVYDRDALKQEDWCVMEIKAPIGTNPNFLSELIATPRRRFSKFSNGMLYVASQYQNSF